MQHLDPMVAQLEWRVTPNQSGICQKYSDTKQHEKWMKIEELATIVPRQTTSFPHQPYKGKDEEDYGQNLPQTKHAQNELASGDWDDLVHND